MSKIFDSAGLFGLGELGKPSNNANSNDTTGLFVSLYLIVLAFFVVMNSISNQDENKVNAATESVTRAFKNPFEPEADFVDVLANEDAITPNDEFYQQVQGIFAALIGFEGRFPAKGGNILKVNLKSSDLFEDKSIVFRPDQQNFLQQLADFLSGGDVRQKREINMIISSGKTFPKGPQYWKDINILRTGAFVQKLREMGVTENQISVGIFTGKENRMALTLYYRNRSETIRSLKGTGIKKLLPGTEQNISIPDNLQNIPVNKDGV